MSNLNDEFDDFKENENSTNKLVGMGRVRMAMMRWWVIVIFSVLGYVAAIYTLSIAEPSHRAVGVMEIITTKQHLVGAELEQERLAMASYITTVASKMVAPSQLSKVVNSPKIQAIEKAIPPRFSMKPKYWRTAEELNYKSAAEVQTGDIVNMIRGGVAVRPRGGTTLLDITVTHKDSQTAVTIVDAIMEAYLETELTRKSGDIIEAFKILRDESNELAQDLESTQRSMEAYKSVMTTDAQFRAKRDQLVLLKQRYKSKHPRMIESTALHDDLKQRFRREIGALLQLETEREFWALYREPMSQYDAVIADQAADDAVKEEAAENWLSFVQRVMSARVGLLQARIGNKQSLYDRVTKRIAEIDVAEENDEGEIKIAEPAYPSGNVVTDKYKRLGQGLVGGALLGFGIAYVLGMIDYKIYDVRTLEEAAGLPCLAAIPEGEGFVFKDEWENVLTAEPNTSNAEAIRNLRASITLLGRAERHKVILITSAAPGEGKTTVALELAAAFALNEQKTIIVDLDLRKPRMHSLFPKLNADLGMADVLAGQAELDKVVQKTHLDGLHLVCAGSKAPNPAELLQENELHKIISTLSEDYDRVVIDTAPVLPVSDTRLLVRHAQSVILVVRSLKAPVGAIMRAKQLLATAQAPLVGVVLNGMKRKHLGGEYYGYRGYGEFGGSGGYGGYYEDKK